MGRRRVQNRGNDVLHGEKGNAAEQMIEESVVDLIVPRQKTSQMLSEQMRNGFIGSFLLEKQAKRGDDFHRVGLRASLKQNLRDVHWLLL